MLVEQIKRFFASLTDNKKVIELSATIQQGLEKGNTAIDCHEKIDDKLISTDGSYGYIVQADNKAAFRRFYNQEQALAEDFNASQTIEIDEQQLAKAIKNVEEILNSQLDKQDKQWQASIEFLKHSRYILSGGPGTGKTTTVIRMLLLFKGLNPESKIALAAPTGKAANRMMQSMNNMLPEEYQQQAQTLHRLLGYNYQKNTVKYNQDNLLPYDLIIIDEASMLDVTLAYRLIKALKPKAQLLLIGDRNQLPSVEAGNVFADLGKITQKNSTELIQNFRFKHDSKIAQLCNSLIEQDASQFKQISEHSNPKNKQEQTEQLQEWYNQIGNESAIILSPVKHGTNSVTQLNDLAMQILYKGKKFNENMPIIANQNDYTLKVFNGDIGHLKLIDCQWQVPFVIEGKQSLIKLDAIKNWQVAHAITIHKSQGSEYDHVLITLPDDLELEILTNSLLYTAISRAKKSVTIWSNDKILSKTIKTKEKRKTFLKNS